MGNQELKCSGGWRHRLPGARRLARLCIPVILAGTGGLALCQTPIQMTAENSRLLAYDKLFFRVMWLQDTADKLESQDMTGAGVRSVIARDYGLTEAQQAQLIAIAADWRTRFNANRDQAKALMAAGERGPTSPALQELLAARLKMTAEHIDQLRAALGPMRLAAMEALVTKPAATPAGPGGTTTGASRSR